MLPYMAKRDFADVIKLRIEVAILSQIIRWALKATTYPSKKEAEADLA